MTATAVRIDPAAYEFTLGNCLEKIRCKEEHEDKDMASKVKARAPTLLLKNKGDSSMSSDSSSSSLGTSDSSSSPGKSDSSSSSPGTSASSDSPKKGGVSPTSRPVAMSRYFKNPYEDFQGYKQHPIVDGLYSQEEASTRIGDIVAKIDENKAAIAKDKDGGVYTGPMGVVYAFMHVADSGVMGKEGAKYLMEAADAWSRACMDYIVRKSERVDDEKRVGFLFGLAGTYVVDAAIAKRVEEEERMMKDIRRFDQTIEPMLKKNFHSDELLEGRAGWLCAALWLRKTLDIDEVVPYQYNFAVCDAMFRSGRRHASKNKSKCPLMYAYDDEEYLGAAHGLSSILLMFLSVPGYLSARPKVNAAVKKTLAYLLKLQRKDGHFPCDMVEARRKKRKGTTDLVQWCHGAPGVVYLMAKAYEVYGGQEYLMAAIKCGEVIWKKGLLKKGPGLCHGIAGNAYAFLVLYRYGISHLKYDNNTRMKK